MSRTLAILLSAFTSAAAFGAGDLEQFVGDYRWISGSQFGEPAIACPSAIRVVRSAHDGLEVVTSNYGDSVARFPNVGGGTFSCVNHGNPISNRCYRTRSSRNAVTLEQGDKSNLIFTFKVRRFWRISKSSGTLRLNYESAATKNECIYR